MSLKQMAQTNPNETTTDTSAILMVLVHFEGDTDLPMIATPNFGGTGFVRISLARLERDLS